jgi:hypothetical protein
VLVPERPFQAYILFASFAGDYLGGEPERWAPTLLLNILLGWEGSPGTNIHVETFVNYLSNFL